MNTPLINYSDQSATIPDLLWWVGSAGLGKFSSSFSQQPPPQQQKLSAVVSGIFWCNFITDLGES